MFVIYGLAAAYVLIGIGIHVAGDYTLSERWVNFRHCGRWFWCAVRCHPYPKIEDQHDYDEPMVCWSPPRCSNCGADIPWQRGTRGS